MTRQRNSRSQNNFQKEQGWRTHVPCPPRFGTGVRSLVWPSWIPFNQIPLNSQGKLQTFSRHSSHCIVWGTSWGHRGHLSFLYAQDLQKTKTEKIANKCYFKWMDGWMDGLTDKWMNGWMDGDWMDGWWVWNPLPVYKWMSRCGFSDGLPQKEH